MEAIKVEISKGIVELKDMIKSKEMQEAMAKHNVGKPDVDVSSFFRELMPFCIVSHPWGEGEINFLIDNCTGGDYLSLFLNMQKVINISGAKKGE